MPTIDPIKLAAKRKRADSKRHGDRHKKLSPFEKEAQEAQSFHELWIEALKHDPKPIEWIKPFSTIEQLSGKISNPEKEAQDFHELWIEAHEQGDSKK